MTAHPWQAEPALLFACAAAPAGETLDDALAAGVRTDFDPAQLLGLATAHRVRPQLLRAIPRTLRERCPGLRRDLEEVAAANAGHARFLTAELMRALEALRAGGVPALAFKGPAFADLVASGAAEREMDDLDLLVAADDVPRAVDALSRLGYEATLPRHAIASRWLDRAGHELQLVRGADGMLVELHWRLAPAWYPQGCSVAEATASATRRPFLDGQLAWPRPEHLLLMHVADGMKSRGSGLRWLADIAAVMRRHPGLAWEEVRAIAARHGALDGVRIALAAVHAACESVASRWPTLRDDLPAQALAGEAQASGRLRSAVAAILARAQDPRRGSATEHFAWAVRTADRPFSQVGAIARYLAAPAMTDLRDLPDPPRPPWAVRLRSARRRLRAHVPGA